jgi:pimeloyl-ACP methyl ester carboxylesterase
MKDFAIKLSGFTFFLVLLQILVSMVFPAEIPPEIVRLDEYLADGVDIVYFGDSTLSLPEGEVTTGEILQELLPDYMVGQISYPAYGLDLYLNYVKYIVRSNHHPDTIIVPINVRSFSPEWDMRPAYQFERETKILTLGVPLSRMLFRPLKVFGLFDPPISQSQFEKAPVYDGDTLIGVVKDFEGETASERLPGDVGNVYREVKLEDDEKAEDILKYHYMFSLKPDHHKLKVMLRIAELADKNDMDIIFYITSVNYLLGERFLGSAFSERLAANIEVVQSLLAANRTANMTVLDLGFGLEAYAFVDMEHLTEIGKEYVAEQLAQAIQPEQPSTSKDLQNDSSSVTPTPEPSPTQPTKTPTVVLPSPPPTLTKRPVSLTLTVTGSMPTAPASTATLTATVPTKLTPTVTVTISASATSPVATPSVTATMVPIPVSHAVSGGDITSVEYIKRFWPEGKYPVDMYRLWFQTVDESDQLVETRADIYIPSVETETEFPVLGHAAGTTGIGDRCAPLDEQARGRDWGNYHGHSLAYAAQGYIVILPNWLGFDDPDRLHPYFIAKLQGRTLLDAARAAYRFWEGEYANDVLARPAKAVFFMGYSSGGHAVFAAKDRARAYAPDLPVKGIIGFGPTTNVEVLLKEDPVFSPYIVYAYRDFYGDEIIDPADVYLSHWVPTFENDVLNKCVDDIFAYYSRSARWMYLPEFRAVLYGDRLAEVFPRFAGKLSENNAGVSDGWHIPVLILQGTADTIVTPPSQEKFVNQLCDMGNSVTYLEYDAVSHTYIRWNSFRDALAWMDNITNGGVPESHCVDFTQLP